jgi:hypothetical protein
MRDNLTPEQREFMQQYIFAMQNKIENLELSNKTYEDTIMFMKQDNDMLLQRLNNLEQQHINLLLKIDNMLFSFQNIPNAVFSGRSAS